MLRMLRRLLLPPQPAGGSPLLQRAAWAMHRALYAAMVALPVTGALDRWARGRRLAVFGGIEVPSPFPVGGGKAWGEAHELIAYALLALVIVHAAAALWHHLVLRDGRLRSMLPLGRG